MKNSLIIVVAGALAMLCTSAFIAIATDIPTGTGQRSTPARRSLEDVTQVIEIDPLEDVTGLALAYAQTERPRTGSEAELVAQLDRVIESQLREIKRQLRVTALD